jgi:hypothetical protein
MRNAAWKMFWHVGEASCSITRCQSSSNRKDETGNDSARSIASTTRESTASCWDPARPAPLLGSRVCRCWDLDVPKRGVKPPTQSRRDRSREASPRRTSISVFRSTKRKEREHFACTSHTTTAHVRNMRFSSASLSLSDIALPNSPKWGKLTPSRG